MRAGRGRKGRTDTVKPSSSYKEILTLVPMSLKITARWRFDYIFAHFRLLSKLVPTFVTMKSQLYLEVSHKVSHFVSNVHNLSQNGDPAVTLR